MPVTSDTMPAPEGARGFAEIPQWTDLETISAHENRLLKRSWELLSEAARLLNAGETADVQDLLADAVDVERRYQAAAEARSERGPAHGAH